MSGRDVLYHGRRHGKGLESFTGVTGHDEAGKLERRQVFVSGHLLSENQAERWLTETVGYGNKLEVCREVIAELRARAEFWDDLFAKNPHLLDRCSQQPDAGTDALGLLATAVYVLAGAILCAAGIVWCAS